MVERVKIMVNQILDGLGFDKPEEPFPDEQIMAVVSDAMNRADLRFVTYIVGED